MKKKIFAVILMIVLLAGLAVPALAGADVRYVNASKLNVYQDMDTSSKVIRKLKGGAQLLIERDFGSWVAILVEDTKRGGQTLGYVDASKLSSSMPPAYCKHKWEKWEIVHESTCTEKGMRTRVCTVCGKVQDEMIKALGHKWSSWKVLKEATCVKKGKHTRTCKVCGETATEEFYADHQFGGWTVTKEASCTATGLREHTCKVCQKTEEQKIDKLPHDYEWKVIVETTDHSSGTRAKVCKNCGYETSEESFDPDGTLRRKARGEDVYHMQELLIEQGYLNKGGADGIFGGGTEKALMKYQKDRNLNPDGIGWPQTLKDLEHDFGPWETEKEMSRVEDGVRVRVCQGCGFEQRETIPSGTVFEKGRRGEDVRALQQIMKELGYDAGSLDGIYGKKLDNALAGYAKDREIIVETGKIRPADIDAVFNSWLEKKAGENWKGEGNVDSTVNLALTVTPVDEADDRGIVTFNWSLTNLGSEKATFTALLLTFGDEPDFKADNLVILLDGANLKKDSGNSVTGSFSADKDWGEGKMNFAALAVNDKTGEIWLSNTVDY